jgi:hypothetical protein
MSDHFDLDEGIDAILKDERTDEGAKRALHHATTHLGAQARTKAFSRLAWRLQQRRNAALAVYSTAQ